MDEILRQELRSGDYVQSVTVGDPNNDGRSASVDILHAGRFDKGYPSRVYDFDWRAFYGRHPFALRSLADALAAGYAYVLVDSRTGLTDIGSICTVLLPEKLVVVFTPNEQSLNGATEVGGEAVQARVKSSDMRPLPLFPLLSRVENAEDALQRKWIASARDHFEKVFRDVYELPSCDLTAYFDAVRIPHKSAFAFGEQIAAEEQRITERGSLAAAFYEFAVALQCNNVIDSQAELQSRLIAPNEAQARAAEAERRAKEAESRAALLEAQVTSARGWKWALLAALVAAAATIGVWFTWFTKAARFERCLRRELAATA
ncbi:MAG TPA: hypothetical protein VKU41_05270 [Polyangiaceae bacterium]|nr:hypothetical protein [Polyangiaceae bacterium]